MSDQNDIIKSVMGMVDNLRDDARHAGYEHRKAIAEAIEAALCGLIAKLAKDITVTGLPDCTVTPEVSEGVVKLHVQPAPPAPAGLASLRALIDIIERTGGYMTPADQESMRTAREVLAERSAR